MYLIDKHAYVVAILCDMRANERCWSETAIHSTSRKTALAKLKRQGWLLAPKHACPACAGELKFLEGK